MLAANHQTFVYRLATLLLFAIGCGKPTGEDIGFRPSKEALPSSPLAANGRLLRLEHDFGLLRPDERAAHDFVVHNNTSEGWTVDRVQVSCRCTVSKISSSTIPRGGKATVSVSYKAPDGFEDAKRLVRVVFKESHAPRVELVLRAKIRPPLAIVPKELLFSCVQVGGHAESGCELLGFTKDDMADLDIKCPLPWVRAHLDNIERAPRVSDPSAPAQRCRLTVTVDASEVKAADYKAVITIAHRANPITAAALPLFVRVAQSVTAAPSHIFFATLKPGTTKRKTLFLNFAGDVPAILPSAIVELDGDLDTSCLNISWSDEPPNASSHVRRLNATLVAPARPSVVRGTATLSFGGDPSVEIRLPVYGRVDLDAN